MNIFFEIYNDIYNLFTNKISYKIKKIGKIIEIEMENIEISDENFTNLEKTIEK